MAAAEGRQTPFLQNYVHISISMFMNGVLYHQNSCPPIVCSGLESVLLSYFFHGFIFAKILSRELTKVPR